MSQSSLAPHAVTEESAAYLGPAGAVEPAALHILLISHDPRDAMYLRQLLARARAVRCRVDSASDLGHAVHRMFSGAALDLILLDLDLPDLADLGMVQHLASMVPATPIIVLGTVADEPRLLRAVELGAQDYCVKESLSAEGLGRSIRCAIQRHRFVASLRGLSLTDDLTGLFNRRGFTTVSTGHLRLGARVGSRFLMVFGDLDNLKTINDTHGHAAGDDALRVAAGVLRGTFRQSDIVARFGGDEFAVLALESANDAGQGIRRRVVEGLEIANALRLEAGTPKLTMSLGIVPCPTPDPDRLHDYLQAADRALYADKRRRRARTAS